jgi:hypothetical protein
MSVSPATAALRELATMARRLDATAALLEDQTDLKLRRLHDRLEALERRLETLESSTISTPRPFS